MSAPQNSAPTRQLPPLCESCQYCPNCDPNPGQPTQRLRFCNHGLGRIAINASSHQDCPATAPLRRSANSVPQSSIPRDTPTTIVPPSQSNQRQRRQDETAHRGTHFIDVWTKGDARAHLGNNYRFKEVPQYMPVEGPVRFEHLTTSGNARLHAGGNYTFGYPPSAPTTEEELEIAAHLK
jgi:hypothetical protein